MKIRKGFFMKKREKYFLNLQLFAEASEGAVNMESGENASADAEQKNKDLNCENNTEINSEENLKNNDDYLIEEEFNELINGKFKEQFRKKTQSIIDKRFKETKILEEYKNNVSPILNELNKKYNIDENNFEELKNIILNENNYSGEDNDFQNNYFDQDNSEENNINKNNINYLKNNIFNWIKEGEKLKEIYPEFDFRTEIKNNPLFSKLLHNNISLKDSYELVHKDEILSGAMAYTAQKVKEQVVKGIEARGRRPLENGISSDAGIVTLTDVNALTSKDILKILKQVENGISVKF